MNKIVIAEIIPFSLIDYPNLVSAVFFTPFCNWRCRYCHNKDLWNFDGEGKNYKSFLEKKEGVIDAIVICGGEPTIHNWIPELIDEIKFFGYKVKLDTNGSNPNKLKEVIGKIDFVAMDIKSTKKRYSDIAQKKVDLNKIDQSIDLIRKEKPDKHIFRHTDVGLSFSELVEMQELTKEPVFLQRKV